jgi:hypothetical protein
MAFSDEKVPFSDEKMAFSDEKMAFFSKKNVKKVVTLQPFHPNQHPYMSPNGRNV